MALGVILVDIRGQYRATASFESILFGSIFFISKTDVWTAWVMAIIVLALVLMLFVFMSLTGSVEAAASAKLSHCAWLETDTLSVWSRHLPPGANPPCATSSQAVAMPKLSAVISVIGARSRSSLLGSSPATLRSMSS